VENEQNCGDFYIQAAADEEGDANIMLDGDGEGNIVERVEGEVIES